MDLLLRFHSLFPTAWCCSPYRVPGSLPRLSQGSGNGAWSAVLVATTRGRRAPFRCPAGSVEGGWSKPWQGALPASLPTLCHSCLLSGTPPSWQVLKASPAASPGWHPLSLLKMGLSTALQCLFSRLAVGFLRVWAPAWPSSLLLGSSVALLDCVFVNLGCKEVWRC